MSKQEKRGYGRILIEQALPRQLGALTELRFEDSGLACMIDLPLKNARRNDFG